MSKNIRIAVVVPAFNESKAIESVVKGLISFAQTQGLDMTVVVVNDCSTDNTGHQIKQLSCVDLHLPVNLGIGGAVQTGMKYAYLNGFDFAIQVDGDGQHPANEISKLLAEARSSEADVVIGSRFLNKQGFQSSAMRRAGIKYFSWLNTILTRGTIHDTTSGFRLLNKKALALVNQYYPDEYPEPESLVLYARFGLKVSETAVVMKERDGGISSIGSLDAVYYMFKVTLACVFTFIRLGKTSTKSA
jgi:glycosyltransferase involved in cell wall biosynthesis